MGTYVINEKKQDKNTLLWEINVIYYQLTTMLKS